jgi:hypothetical protein
MYICPVFWDMTLIPMSKDVISGFSVFLLQNILVIHVRIDAPPSNEAIDPSEQTETDFSHSFINKTKPHLSIMKEM